MDETYIEQCNCPEIQDVAPLEPGARVWFPIRGKDPAGIVIFGENDIGDGNSDGWNKTELLEEGCVILPRQEDIQAMLEPEMIAKYLPYTTMAPTQIGIR